MLPESFSKMDLPVRPGDAARRPGCQYSVARHSGVCTEREASLTALPDEGESVLAQPIDPYVGSTYHSRAWAGGGLDTYANVY
jgi:hypothetical protein